MAASGNIRTNVTSDGYIYLQLSWSEASQNIAGNYTNINWNLKLVSTGHGANIVSSAAKSCTVKFNGTTVFSGTVNIGLSAGQTKTLRSGSNFRINHNSDGKKTFSYSFSQQINITYSGAYIGTKSASGSGTLDTIPRASSIKSISGSTIGSPVTVAIDRKVSSFTHKVYYSFGSKKNSQVASNAGTSAVFTPPMSDCSLAPNAASGTAAIRVDTYSGGAKIGTASKNFTLNVPASVKPAIESFTAERIDGTVPSDWGIYVKGKSKAKLTISGAAAGGYGATLKSYSITGGGYTGSTAEYTTGFLNTAGTVTFTGKVTDSRGRTASRTVSVTVEDYAPPVIQSASAARCGASGDLQDDGAYVLATHSLTYSSLGGKNSLSRSYRFRRVGETGWQSAQYTQTEAGDIVGAGDISPDYSYEIELKAEDGLENVSRILSVSTAKVIMDWKKGGAGMAIGKVAEKDGLEVAWPAYFSDGIYSDGKPVLSREDLPTEPGFYTVHATYGYMGSFPFWRAGMSTFEFLAAMPNYSYIKVIGNPDANFSDAPCEYCQYELLKGSANYKAGWAHMVSSAPANSLFHYCAGAGTEGFWGKVNVTKV